MEATLPTTGDGATERDPFDELDQALAVNRSLSRRIRCAAERGDAAALERLQAQRVPAGAAVDRLLAETSEILAAQEAARRARQLRR